MMSGSARSFGPNAEACSKTQDVAACTSAAAAAAAMSSECEILEPGARYQIYDWRMLQFLDADRQ